MKAINKLCCVLVLIGYFSSLAQNKQRMVTKADYKLWSTMTVEQLSEAGNWVSYSLYYESGNDTLFVKNTKSLRTYSIANGSNGRFVKECYFICQTNDGQLLLQNLGNGKKKLLGETDSYCISNGSQYLIAHLTGKNKQELLIRDLERMTDTVIPAVSTYSYNPNANAIVFTVKGRLILLDLTTKIEKTVMVTSAQTTYSDFTWQKNGQSIAYFVNDSINSIGHYKIEEQQNYIFNPLQFVDFPLANEIYNSSFTALTISDDGTKVFFGIKPKEVVQQTTGVQLWNTADKSLYPDKSKLKDWTVLPKVCVWFIKDNHFKTITDSDFPHLMLTGDHKNALLFNPIGNEPQFDRDAPIDFYLSNIETGKKQLILTKQSCDYNKLSTSGTGRFIAYFRDGNWWVYDILENEHRNLTAMIKVPLTDENYNRSGEKKAAGIAGWTTNDSGLLIYDTYDLWFVKTDGSGCKRLTDGRVQNISYRVVPQSAQNGSQNNFSWTQKGTYHLNYGLLLKATGELNSGYFKWNEKQGSQPIVFNSNRIYNLKISEVNNVCIYTQEHYHLSPKLMSQTKNDKPKLLFQSNAHQKNYKWGFSKLISFQNSKGNTLKGALFYPADYTAKKTYPMVVHIYEMQAGQYNQYVNPTVYNYDGFNISNFTSQGYFVLLPDIWKEEGDPGRSAVDCVTAAVNGVLAHEVVDPKRVGLLGHSFGGYQTNFIITQTNIFAAAISGSGIADIVSDYLHVSWNNSKHNGWRYEFNQASIGASLFDDYEAYIRNSPITYAKQIQTPLLLWTGDKDRVVHYFQSLELHMALRRLQKPNILLLYEGGSHSLGNRDHQTNLTHRMQEWFDYYLKGDSRPEWLEPNKL